jgi:hypothetical protein
MIWRRERERERERDEAEWSDWIGVGYGSHGGSRSGMMVVDRWDVWTYNAKSLAYLVCYTCVCDECVIPDAA